MSYLGEYRNETRRQGIKDKMLTNLKLIPDWNKQLKNIKFLCHVCRLVATKCKGNDALVQKDIVISIYTDLFGQALTSAEKGLLVENIDLLQEWNRIHPYTRLERLLNAVFDYFRAVY